MSRPRVLMCSPTHYGVHYVINPWMEGNVGRADRSRAQEQWDELYRTVQDYADVDLIEPDEGLPDMAFTANYGLVCRSVFVPARYRVKQRAGEVPLASTWFDDHDFAVQPIHDPGTFEGEGDALFQPGEPLLWAGYGVRTSLQVYREIEEALEVELALLRLVDERFYHLDTCLCPLADGRVIYYPPAFDQDSIELIRSRVPQEKRYEVSDEDALQFACNAVAFDGVFIANYASHALRERLAAWGYTVMTTPLSEFMLAGGAAKCLVLRLDNDPPRATPDRVAMSRLAERRVTLEGQLLDTGLMNEVLDRITEGGGSFEVEEFRAGIRHDQDSIATVRVVAPNAERLETIVRRLIQLGAQVVEKDVDARLEPVVKDGVAPHDFYSTTIYPTDVRVNGEWVRVSKQRMDAVIVARDGAAECALIRDLRVGDRVVTHVEGIRIHPAKAVASLHEFEFMASGVSSERRVELAVDNIAWEMGRIKQRGGKIVVVAGPVVIHTGGGPHLAQLIRTGYVQALLGGNAIAVHDIESNFFGTSLGVDLDRGVGLEGGHRHHLQAINRVRDCGSIAAAVEQGVIRSGVMYECVKNDVPFALAGSIRDDGPLPDTRMDLIESQREYQELVKDADMVLMLASMLHAIGVGNMTPSGVRLICVDISPAVVTKLADRGSVESTGIVTDVGLFLNLLARELAIDERG